VPAAALPGTHWVTAAVAGVTGDAAQAPFTVQDDWAQFHFTPSHSGRNPYENVLNRKSARDLGLSWSYPTGLIVESTPAVVNGVLYAGSADSNVYAVDASSGSGLWQFTTGNVVASSPAVVNGAVYVGSDDYNLYALKASTGAKLWQFTTGNEVESFPAAANGVVYVGSDDNNVYALNASTGAGVWQFTTGGEVSSSPVVANG
jgi:serine/threonine-protein kinase